jgi:colicin import membrane protein
MTPEDKSKSSEPRGVGPDEFSVFMPARARPPGMAARHILFAGVAGACVLGVGLGLWARPAMSERQAAAAKPADAPKAVAMAPARQLEIVVDDRPAPIGKPIDVLPGKVQPSPPIPAPKALPWSEAAPVASAQGLIKTRSVTPEPPPAAPIPKAAPAHAARAKLAPTVVAALVAPKPVAPKAPAIKAPPPAPVPANLAKAAPDRRALAKAHRLEPAQASAAHTSAIRAAQARKLELAQAAKAAKAGRQQQLELARAEARGRAEARAEAKAQALAFARDDAKKRARLAALAHAVQRLLPHKARPEPVEVAKLDRRHAHKTHREPQVERASLRTHKAPHLAEPPVRARAVQVPPPSHASGLMKVSTPRCASRDPGQALVCADPALGAAERQLTRAYQDARNAGVPDMQLQRQQQRWLAARSAAAREAPWAVHDVYLARIAELNGQARDAHGDGY